MTLSSIHNLSPISPPPDSLAGSPTKDFSSTFDSQKMFLRNVAQRLTLDQERMRTVQSVNDLEEFDKMFVTLQINTHSKFCHPLFKQTPKVDGCLFAYLSKEGREYRVSALRIPSLISQMITYPYLNEDDISRTQTSGNWISIAKASHSELARAHRWVSNLRTKMSFDTHDYQRIKQPDYGFRLDCDIRGQLSSELFVSAKTPNPFDSPKLRRRSNAI